MILHRPRGGITLLELLVVSLIIAILTTIAVVAVTGLATRARISATYGTIRAMEIAADRYEIDFGEYPVSSTGTTFGIGATLNPADPATGNGYYLLSVLHTLSGSAAAPLDTSPFGDTFVPMLDVETRSIGGITELNAAWGPILGNFGATETAATQQLLDAWGNPFRYVRSGPGVGSVADYITYDATEFPTGSPFAATETFFNFGRFQIVSLGPDASTLGVPNVGLDDDDITNFGGGL
jgi:prepilin-type N-terminal cleavage/methylation domain-containing protein